MSVAMDGIRKAAKRRERADELRREATDELRDRYRQAQAEGVSIGQIAREAGLSRQVFTTCWQADDLLDARVELATRRNGNLDGLMRLASLLVDALRARLLRRLLLVVRRL